MSLQRGGKDTSFYLEEVDGMVLIFDFTVTLVTFRFHSHVWYFLILKSCLVLYFWSACVLFWGNFVNL
jgi:hypothetical protein